MSKKVLVVEDDPGYLALLKLRLDRAGFDVETAEDGAAATAAFSESPAPVVVSDLVMPGVSGMDVLRFVKAHRPQTAVILLSGKGTIKQAVAAMREGALDFLVKPVEDGKLEGLVAYCFETIDRKKGGAHGLVEKHASERSHPGSGWHQCLKRFSLTRSESGIISLVLKGKTDQEIADALCISYYTVKKHLQNIFRKMDVNNRIELILLIK